MGTESFRVNGNQQTKYRTPIFPLDGPPEAGYPSSGSSWMRMAIMAKFKRVICWRVLGEAEVLYLVDEKRLIIVKQ